MSDIQKRAITPHEINIVAVSFDQKKGITPKIESPSVVPYSYRGDEGGRCVTISPNN